MTRNLPKLYSEDFFFGGGKFLSDQRSFRSYYRWIMIQRTLVWGFYPTGCCGWPFDQGSSSFTNFIMLLIVPLVMFQCLPTRRLCSAESVSLSRPLVLAAKSNPRMVEGLGSSLLIGGPSFVEDMRFFSTKDSMAKWNLELTTQLLLSLTVGWAIPSLTIGVIQYSGGKTCL